jgi:hypothetical protein
MSYPHPASYLRDGYPQKEILYDRSIDVARFDGGVEGEEWGARIDDSNETEKDDDDEDEDDDEGEGEVPGGYDDDEIDRSRSATTVDRFQRRGRGC